MSLNYKYRQAIRLITALTPRERCTVIRVCRDIQSAQDRLCRAAETSLTRCYQACEGLCCRNVAIDTIISHWDFVFILLLAPETEITFQDCLHRENRLYAADCIFLDRGVGPCRFPPGIRPEICIVSFCTETPQVNPMIRQVKRAFFKLTWTMNRLRIQRLMRRMLQSVSRRESALSPDVIQVTAAVIRSPDRGPDQVLIARRSSGHLAGKWEFPGGKIEAGETPETCLAREILEELGIGISITGFLVESCHVYPEKQVRLMAYDAVHVNGEIRPVVHDRVQWVTVDSLCSHDLAPADLPIAQYLKNRTEA
ncbi:MAG: (deoxy)nucleoside triphosphate pyrophosphohydrolase [Pseudomonadota bacterium]